MSSSSSIPPIDIYDCPEYPSLAYKVAVMQAALGGAPVQFSSAQERNWQGCDDPSWDWYKGCYRIAPASKLAPVFKVGDYVTKDGLRGIRKIVAIEDHGIKTAYMHGVESWWYTRDMRLATPEEIRASLLAEAAVRGFKVGARINAKGLPFAQPSPIIKVCAWIEGDEVAKEDNSGNVIDGVTVNKPFVYLVTQASCGHAGDSGRRIMRLDQATLVVEPTLKKVPLTSDDYPGSAFWVRWRSSSSAYLVTTFTADGAMVFNTGGRGYYTTATPEYALEQLEWSVDRKVWNPCWREVQA